METAVCIVRADELEKNYFNLEADGSLPSWTRKFYIIFNVAL
jgi:hypothetical protein